VGGQTLFDPNPKLASEATTIQIDRLQQFTLSANVRASGLPLAQ